MRIKRMTGISPKILAALTNERNISRSSSVNSASLGPGGRPAARLNAERRSGDRPVRSAASASYAPEPCDKTS